MNWQMLIIWMGTVFAAVAVPCIWYLGFVFGRYTQIEDPLVVALKEAKDG